MSFTEDDCESLGSDTDNGSIVGMAELFDEAKMRVPLLTFTI